MAGSYKYCKVDGKFSMAHIENMRDAAEALEMMYWMISDLSGGDAVKIEDSQKMYFQDRHLHPENHEFEI
jgi:hypothetical protein